MFSTHNGNIAGQNTMCVDFFRYLFTLDTMLISSAMLYNTFECTSRSFPMYQTVYNG